MSLTILKTQTNIGYIEGYICDVGVDITKEKRHECGKELWNHCYQWAKENGIQYLVCYANYESLIERYVNLGMTRNTEYLTSLSKDLGV